MSTLSETQTTTTTARAATSAAGTSAPTDLSLVPAQRSSPPLRRAQESDHPSATLVPPLTLLAPAGARLVRNPRAGSVRMLASGTVVILVVHGPFARIRALRTARRAGVVAERSVLAVPDLRRPLALVDDSESAVGYFWNHLVTVPPGLARLYLLANVAVACARRMPWRWSGAFALDYVVIGVRR